MKKKQQPKTRTNRKPPQEMTEEQLQQVVGGIPPGPTQRPLDIPPGPQNIG